MSWIFEGSSAQIDDVILDIPGALEGLIKRGDTSLKTVEYFDCCLCLEKHYSKGIVCSGSGSAFTDNEVKITKEGTTNTNEVGKHHFICQQCFSPYVSSLCDESFKLLDSGGQITCPVPECCSKPWSSHDVRHAVAGTVLEKYIDILVLSLQRATNDKNSAPSSSSSDLDHGKNNQSDVVKTPLTKEGYKEQIKSDVHAIVDSMTIKCPNASCSVALDPTPDGCCAMRCYSCGKHFCWLCFSIQSNSSLCHSHVRKCSENPNVGTLFANKFQIETCHRRRSIEAIRRYLTEVAAKSDDESDSLHSESNSESTVSISTTVERNTDDIEDSKIDDVIVIASNKTEAEKSFDNNICEQNYIEEPDETATTDRMINNIKNENDGFNPPTQKSAKWQTSMRCIDAVKEAAPILIDAGILLEDIFSSNETSPSWSQGNTSTTSGKNNIWGWGWDWRLELRNSMWVLLTVFEALLGWRMVSSYICSVLGFSSWYFCTLVWSLMATVAVWRPAEVVLSYFILGFFQFVKTIVFVRSFLLPKSIWLQTAMSILVAVWLRHVNTTESNIVISIFHLVGMFIIDISFHIIYH